MALLYPFTSGQKNKKVETLGLARQEAENFWLRKETINPIVYENKLLSKTKQIVTF